MPENVPAFVLLAGALTLTILFESLIAFLLGERRGIFYGAMVCINVMTNLSLNLFLLALYRIGMTQVFGIVLLCEAGIVLAEWRLLLLVFPKQKRRMFLLSLAMNGGSFLFGELLFQMLPFQMPS